MPTPEFIVELREHIGHAMLWLSGAATVIVRRTPQVLVLLAKRADSGYWDLIAGIIEPGEHPEETLVREALEEVGVRIAPRRLLQVVVDEPITCPNGDVCQFLNHVYVSDWLAGEPQVCDDESTDVGWFAPDALPQPLRPGVAERIALAFESS